MLVRQAKAPAGPENGVLQIEKGGK